MLWKLFRVEVIEFSINLIDALFLLELGLTLNWLYTRALFRDWSKVDRVVVEESAAGLYIFLAICLYIFIIENTLCKNT